MIFRTSIKWISFVTEILFSLRFSGGLNRSDLCQRHNAKSELRAMNSFSPQDTTLKGVREIVTL